MESVLGQIALQATHPENVATEALCYVLRKSDGARAALGQFLVSMGAATMPDLDYRTQAALNDEGTPDLVGQDGLGRERVIIEAKFWAGLTEHQPVSYIARLAPDSVLAFAVPLRRVDLVWFELLSRLRAASIACTERVTARGYRAGELPDGKQLLLFTWGAMLQALEDRLKLDGVSARVDDIRQLQALCTGMADVGFPPLQPAELTNGLWRRMPLLAQMVAEVAAILESKSVVSTGGSRVSSGPAWTSQKLRMRGFEVFLSFDADACARFVATPFWLQLPLAARQHVAALALERPPRLIDHPAGYPYVALRVPVGVERDAIISALVLECEAVAALFPPLSAIAGSAPAPVAAPIVPAPAPAPAVAPIADSDLNAETD